jgi:hypothetical protein
MPMRKPFQNFLLQFMRIQIPALLTLGCALARAEDVYYHVPLASVSFSEGQLPTKPEWNGSAWRMLDVYQPYAVIDGKGEAFVAGPDMRPWDATARNYENTFLAARVPKGTAPDGRLFLPKPDLSGMIVLKFKLTESSATPEAMDQFFIAKESWYRQLRDRGFPGGAWFRHEEAEAAKVRGTNAVPQRFTAPFSPRRPSWDDSYDATYDLFSGGRALGENLQLDRLLPPVGSNTNLVALTNIPGITVRAMEWKPLLHDPKPQLDPLAVNIPFDQHALFFSSFEAMSHWIDEADRDGTPVLRMFEHRAEDVDSRGQYQKQLCLDLSDLARVIGPKLIQSIAFTGSDPYLRMGSDVGLVYETSSPAMLRSLIQTRQAAAQQANPAVKAVKGDIAGITYSGVITEDRTISAYVVALEKVVIVSNSRAQLECLIQVANGKTPALASQEEYVYFRQKYPRTDSGETGFMVLSDATIRRWCGPQWRILDSRRVRAAGLLADIQARYVDELTTGRVHPGSVATNIPGLGDVLLTTNGVFSAAYGTLGFLTPIIELSATRVTQAEAEAYERWRNGYQQNWSQFFDPIAVRFSIQARRLSAEVCVMPLIAGSEYRHFIDVSTGARIAPEAGDPHPEALFHLALALNSESQTIKGSGNLLGSFSPSLKANPLGWLGQCLAVYADQDPFWSELAKAGKPETFLEKNYPRLPVAIYCEIKNPLAATAFLASARAFIQQTAPQMTTWESLQYHDQAYVKITAAQMSRAENAPTNLCVYYAVTPQSLVLTLSEPVLQKALERQQARQAAGSGTQSNSIPTTPWLGTNLCLRIDHTFVPMLETMLRDEFRPAQQRLAWSNLPILNEWKRRYPERDPVEVHHQLWHVTLVCPGGGRYTWNEQWQTMESTLYGHPGQPKPGPDNLLPVRNITSANLGLSFEDQGLSARVVLERAIK